MQLAEENNQIGDLCMIIALEGQNGVGKTTLSKALGKVYGATVMRSSDDTFLYNLKVLLSKNPEKYMLPGLVYYLSALQIASNNIASLNPISKNVIFDRYTYSVLCRYLAIDSAYYNREHRAIIKKLVSCAQEGMIKPDVTILLHADDKERLRRVDERDNGVKVYRYLFDKKFSEEYQKELKQNLKLLRRDGIKAVMVENNDDVDLTVFRIRSLIDESNSV